MASENQCKTCEKLMLCAKCGTRLCKPGTHSCNIVGHYYTTDGNICVECYDKPHKNTVLPLEPPKSCGSVRSA